MVQFFNWMQNRFNGGQAAGSRKGYPVPPPTTNHGKQEPRNEEFSDWPGSFLAIGTLGNNDPPESARKAEENEIIVEEGEEEEQCSSPDLAEFTPEEVGKLQKALTKLLSRKSVSKGEAQSNADLPLDRFLNCPSSLEVDRRLSNISAANSLYDCEEDEIDRTIRAIIGRCKDVCEKNKQHKSIGKKSVSFLVKKMFVCRSGFAPSPSLRDTFQESRMEKLLRTILSKKIYPQNPSRAASLKRFLENKRTSSSAAAAEEEEKKRERTSDSGRWDKTDSECKFKDFQQVCNCFCRTNLLFNSLF
nr:uncharacterized protein LOC109187586 [Ipomoea batatas]